MKQHSNELLRAVRHALTLGTTAAVGLGAAPAFAQDAGQNSDKLETIVVTGSRIRRVDLETSSPVFVIDKSAIEKTGKVTIGDLLQEAPSIAGAATNPSVNNGGGDGASTVSLRGLGSQRTLLLLNGRRVFYNDVNSIPINMVERIEILKDGASSVYGSDAIGGVVNFITRRDFQGLEASVDYGISDRDDGERKGISLTMGHASDRGSVVVGVTYNRQRQVSAGNRDFSKNALTRTITGQVNPGGSSSVPNGRFLVPQATATAAGITGCPVSNGSVALTKKDGAAGVALDDFRCYSAEGATNDSYNFAPFNLELTPTERAGLFVSGNYRISDNVEAYIEAFTNKTRSQYQLAPLPLILGAAQSGAVISKDSLYNPFGVDINSGGYRMSLAGGNRLGRFNTQADQLSAGLRGSFADTWQWDAGVTWARTNQNTFVTGYYFKQGLANATGPSFIDAGGVARCGRAGAVIANCTPINLLGINYDGSAAARANLAALDALSVTPQVHSYATEKTAQFNVTGELFELPAGAVSLAVGGEYRKDYQYNQPDYVALITDPNTGSCLTSVDACRSANIGSLSTKEVYAELFVPVLRDVFLAKSLNLTFGSRYSDYSAFGNSTNSKLGVEWRPIDDLLLRGTVAEVFRAPTISNLYGGVAPSADSITRDPCFGGRTPGNAACKGVSPDVEGYQTNSIQGSNNKTKPEQGKSFTWGVVYDPSWLEGFSTSIDVWRIYLTDTIGTIGTQAIIDQCFTNGTYCSLFTRSSQDGRVDLIFNTTQNVGRVDTGGVDMSFKYRLPETEWGNFRASLDLTYLQKYNVRTLESNIGTQTNLAGSYVTISGQAQGNGGNFTRWRGLAGLNWNLAQFDASWRVKYTGPARFGDRAVTTQRNQVVAPPNTPGKQSHRIGAYSYHNLSAGYQVEPINTRLEIGVDNVFDKQAPVLWQYGFNGNTDERTYDTIGRYYWARVGVKF